MPEQQKRKGAVKKAKAKAIFMGFGRQTFKHTAVYSMATILGKLVSFVMLPFYAHIFDTEGYGIMAMIDTSLGILTVVFTGAFSTGIMRVYHEQTEDRKGLAVSTGVQLVWGLSVVTVIFPIIFSGPISRVILGNANYYPLICLTLVSFVIDVSGQSASTFLLIKQQSVFYSIVGLMRLILGLSLNIWLVVILGVGLIGVFISSLACAVMSSLIFHTVAIRKIGFGFDRQIVVQLLKFQLPLMPGEIASFFGRQAEKIIVRILIGLEGMGVLEMAYKFPQLLNVLISIPFHMTWRTKSIEIAERDEAPQIIGEMFTRYLFSMIFAGLFFAVAIPSILVLMTPPSFWGAARIAQIEIVTTILTGCTTYLSFGIIYRKETKIFMYVRLVLMPLKMALVFAMIHTWGLDGAAYSALIVEAITFAWIVRKAQGLYRIQLQYRKIGFMVAAAVVLFVLLEGRQYDGFGPAVYARDQVLPAMIDFLRSTPLGEWKSGKLIYLFKMKQDQVISLFFNTLLSTSFFSLIPFLRGKNN